MMAKDLNIPVICCAQLSRGTEGHGKNHKPQLADLRESGSIEQDADIVLFLYREAYYSTEVDEDKQDQIDANKTELIVAKNRHGATGSIELTFDTQAGDGADDGQHADAQGGDKDLHFHHEQQMCVLRIQGRLLNFLTKF